MPSAARVNSVALMKSSAFFRAAIHPVKRRLLVYLARLGAAAIGFTALLYIFGFAFRPDVVTPPRPPPAAELAAVQARREDSRRLDLANPPVIARKVDYGAAGSQPWHPRGEAPILAELVREGRLPPVAQRTGPE